MKSADSVPMVGAAAEPKQNLRSQLIVGSIFQKLLRS
jgi:hypothetical protein